MPAPATDPQTTTRNLPSQQMQARLLPTTFDKAERTIEVVCSVGARVRRYDWWEERYYDEELVIDTASVNMVRFNSGACAVLDSHRAFGGLAAQIGVIERAWIADGELRALVRLSGRDELSGIVGDIEAGIIRNLSVGYSVQRMEISHEGDVPLYRAVAWTPHELSFVTVPADPESTTRAQPQGGEPCEFVRINTQEQAMPQSATNRAADPVAPENTPAPQPAPAPADNSRAIEIVELAQRHGMGERAAEFIRENKTVDEVRALILDQLATRDNDSGGHLNNGTVVSTEHDNYRSAVTDALLARAQIINPATKRVFALAGDNPVRGLSLIDLARSSLERCGIRTDGMQKLELVGRAFTQGTSDFPVLLEAAMHKAMQAAYAVAPDTWSRFCATGTVSDFRAHSRYQLGSIGNLDALSELGEFKNKAIPDGQKATVQAGTKGNIINLSRQAIINDDLGAFIGLAAQFGRAARRTIEADVYAFLGSNPLAPDGKALFHTDHGNLANAAAPTVTSVDEARVLMAAQKDHSGNEVLDLRPSIWLGGLAYGGAARVVNGSEYDPDANNKLQRANSVRGLFRDVVDTARITGTQWYLFADPTECPVIEVAFLDGVSEPFLEQEQGFTVDGTRFKARLDFGIGCVGHVGAVRNG